MCNSTISKQIHPLVSVVMTSYNHEKYLSLAIESVLNQTFDDFELIIVDDCSKDSSREIINSFSQQDKRIRKIFHSVNVGISDTTNDGFNAANGHFVAYIQSDDLWMPNKLEKQIAIIQKDNNLIVWSDALIINGDGRNTGLLFTEKYRAIKKPKSGDIFDVLILDNYICGQSILINRQIVQKILFDRRLHYANDYKFMIELASRYKFRFIEDPLVKYRIHDNNTIHKDRKRWKRDFFRIHKYIIQQYGANIPNDTKAKLYNRIGRFLYGRNHYNYANSNFLKSIRLCRRKTSTYRNLLKSCIRRITG